VTPDAVATVRFDGTEVVAFIEVDLASMTQTLLKQKVSRYLAYSDDLAWQDRYPYCPPLLPFTTTATRAATFTRAAGHVLAQDRGRRDCNHPAAALVVAACGHVRDPGNAITEPCWALPDATADLTISEILAERTAAKEASEAWLYERDVVQRRRDDIDALRAIARTGVLADLL